MIVILAPGFVELPSAATESAEPVVRGPAAICRLRPEIPVGACVRARRTTLDKPWMLVRRVVWHQIDDQLDVGRVDCPYEPVELLHCADMRIDGAVLGNIITKIAKRGRIKRRKPNRVYPKRLHVVETLQQSCQITPSIIITVLEGNKRDLVDDRVLPPIFFSVLHVRLRSRRSCSSLR